MFPVNIPTVSFGLALGWVSLASGEGGPEASRGAVVASVTTFTASLVGVPLSARALAAGRKVALIGTSASFVVGTNDVNLSFSTHIDVIKAKVFLHSTKEEAHLP